MARARADSKDLLAEELGKQLESGTLKPSKKYGISLVGLGRSGHFHLTSIKNLAELVELKWAIDTNETVGRRIAQDMGCQHDKKIEPSLEDPSVDIVIIASTTDTHFPFIMSALKAKKAVFAEKPISHTVAEVQEAVDLALKTNVPFVW